MIMALKNVFCFSHTVFEAEKFLSATHNKYKIVSVRPYVDKKGVLPEGYSVEMKVLVDDYDYGLNKDGQPREDNVDNNFEVIIHSRKIPLKKGDYVRLLDFDEEHSMVIGFDTILRFRSCEKLQPKTK